MHRARNNQHANRAATSSNADRSANLDHLAGAALVGSLTTWRLALTHAQASASLTPAAAVGQRTRCCGRGRSVGSFGLVGAPRSRASFVIVAPQRQATSTCKVTAAQVRKQAEEDTFINKQARGHPLVAPSLALREEPQKREKLQTNNHATSEPHTHVMSNENIINSH